MEILLPHISSTCSNFMDKIHEAFDDLVDNCFADEDLLNTSGVDNSLDVEQEGEPKTCLVSLMDEPKVA
tara:strand:- start:6 stop:212 length:207 start_codon:yes stop_codon:yes gene_type:complete